jgi:hypothetical protein
MTPHDELALAVSRRRMRLPFEAACVDCGERHPLVLNPWRRSVRCYECWARRAGRATVEPHHLGGRPSPLPVVWVPLNQHVVLTLLQELYWRRWHEPGSPYAVAFDLGALTGVRLGWTGPA